VSDSKSNVDDGCYHAAAELGGSKLTGSRTWWLKISRR